MVPETLQLLGRARLMDEMREDGVNVALPADECGIDMLAYIDSRSAGCPIVSVPLKVTSFPSTPFPSDLQTARAPALHIALVWTIGDSEQVRAFAFTPAELTVLKMIEIMERAKSVASDDHAFRLALQAVLRNALEPFAMSRGKWREKIAAILEDELK